MNGNRKFTKWNVRIVKTAADAAGRWEELRGAKEVKNKTIYKRALKLAIPMMIQNGITNMVGLIDNVRVGSIGTEAMTAVSIVGQLLFLILLFSEEYRGPVSMLPSIMDREMKRDSAMQSA